MPVPPSPSTADLVAILRARGQRVTSQRLIILRELRRRAHHLSAAEVTDAVRDELPGTSTPTVYATLDLLAELGLVRKLSLGSGTALFDARVAPHQHTVCRRCGAVEDLDVEVDSGAAIEAARAAGFAPAGAELVIDGVCARCARASGA